MRCGETSTHSLRSGLYRMCGSSLASNKRVGTSSPAILRILCPGRPLTHPRALVWYHVAITLRVWRLAMSSFSKEAFLEKIARLSLSQDSIETLSLWAIQHKAHAADATQAWLEALKKGKCLWCHVTKLPLELFYAASADKRLVLFYLANDILQNGRRRGADQFLELFQDPLRQGVTLIGCVLVLQATPLWGCLLDSGGIITHAYAPYYTPPFL